MAYQSVSEFKSLTLIPAAWVDELETVAPGWLSAQLAYWSDWIDSQLRKRYLVPFEAPYTQTVVGWLNRIVTWRCCIKRGVNPTDQQFSQIVTDSDNAYKEIAQAADSVTGLYDLPLRGDNSRSGIAYGPVTYSEQSPYVSFDIQRQRGRSQDQSGSGGSGLDS